VEVTMSRAEFSNVLVEALKLSGVREGKRVALVTTYVYNRERARHMESFRAALNELGTEFVTIELPPRGNGQRPVDPLGPFATDLLRAADFVVRSAPDPFFPQTPEVDMYTDLFTSVLDSGTRWLDFMLDENSIWRLFPTPELIERTIRGAERLAQAEEIRLSSTSGTDLKVRKDGRKGSRQCGVVDDTASWDNFGFGLVSCAPLENSAEGVLVASPGDAFAQVALTHLDTETTTLHFEQGKVTSIQGGATADRLKRAVARFENQDGAHRIAHMGWGTLDAGIWGGNNFTLAEWESYYGCVHVHFGTNTWDTPSRLSGLGGTIPPGIFHWGGSLMNHSLWLDDEQIIEDGRIVATGLA
jgi:hypothetical protein